jgi:pimeloyl-ACP methyl ester carboxylesterase
MTAQFCSETNLSFHQTTTTTSSDDDNKLCVLLIHGLGCSKRWFDIEENRPDVEFSWLVPDLFGYGFSKDASANDAETNLNLYTMKAQAELLLQLALNKCEKGSYDMFSLLVLSQTDCLLPVRPEIVFIRTFNGWTDQCSFY